MTRNIAIVGGGTSDRGERDAMWKDLVQEGEKATFDDVQSDVRSDRRVDSPTTGLIHNLSGSGSVHSIMVLDSDPR